MANSPGGAGPAVDGWQSMALGQDASDTGGMGRRGRLGSPAGRCDRASDRRREMADLHYDGSAPSDISVTKATDAQETSGSMINDTQAVEDTEEADAMAHTDMEQNLENFVAICAQNPDALVSEAAANMRGKD